MKPKQVKFQVAKDSDIPLNAKQMDMLALLGDAGPDGAVVYGRGPTETVKALKARELVATNGIVLVVVMGKLEDRPLWCLTAKGAASLGT